MGVVCSAIASIFSAIGRGIMAVISAIGSVLNAIVGGITSVFVSIFSCLGDIFCCRSPGGRRRGGRV
ncbi:hypothetical protein JCM10207_007728 [Rhodosporidiobolus poonsookiae]